MPLPLIYHFQHDICLHCALVLATLLTAMAGTRGYSDGRPAAADLHAAGTIQSLEVLIERVTRLRPGKVIDAELRYEDAHHTYVYEIQILDSQGRVWELELDARSGALLEHKQEGD